MKYPTFLFILAIAISGCQGNSPQLKENSNQMQEENSQKAEFDASHSNYSHLKELEWLVGSWIDQDQDDETRVLYETQWDLNKNYLSQKFDSNLFKEEGLQGYQLIGWDPIREQVRSWVFDSDGGFGEGYWTKEGKNWVARMRFTLGDGRQGTATNIYTKEDDNSYSFASRDRDIDGVIMPDIEPFKIVKSTQRQGR